MLNAHPFVSFPRPVPMYLHDKPGDFPVTLDIAQKSGLPLQGRPPHWKSRIHNGHKAWLNTLEDSWEYPNNLGWSLVSFSFPCLLAVVSSLLNAHVQVLIPLRNFVKQPFFYSLLEFLPDSTTFIFTSIPFLSQPCNPSPLSFEISHLYVPDISLQNFYSSLTPWPPYESMFRFLIEGLYNYFILISIPTASMDAAHSPSLATRLVRFPWVMPSNHLISGHQRTMSVKSPTHQRTNRIRIIEFEYRNGRNERAPHGWGHGEAALSLCFRTFFPLSLCLIFVYLYLVLSYVPAALTGILLAVRIFLQHVLCAFLTFTIGAYGMDDNTRLHTCSNQTRIAIFVSFFKFFYYLQTSLTNSDQYEERRPSERERDVELGIMLGRTAGLRGCHLAMEWAVWRRYYLSWNASAASSGLESK